MLRAGTLASAFLLLAGAGLAAERAKPAVGTAPVPVPVPAPVPVRYRIETAGLGVLWSADHPLQSGDQVLFHQYPGGTLVSLKRSEIRRVSAERPAPQAAYVDIGATAARHDPASVPGVPGAAKSAKPELPGARPDGTALFNPDRKYQPDIDAKQVPGLNTGYPNSLNDNREGRTLSFPAAPAQQAQPGDPPKMPQ